MMQTTEERNLSVIEKVSQLNQKIREILLAAPTGFNPTHGIGDLVWCSTQTQEARRQSLKAEKQLS